MIVDANKRKRGEMKILRGRREETSSGAVLNFCKESSVSDKHANIRKLYLNKQTNVQKERIHSTKE